MKSLQQYINEQLREQPNFYKRFGIIVDELELETYLWSHMALQRCTNCFERNSCSELLDLEG